MRVCQPFLELSSVMYMCVFETRCLIFRMVVHQRPVHLHPAVVVLLNHNMRERRILKVEYLYQCHQYWSACVSDLYEALSPSRILFRFSTVELQASLPSPSLSLLLSPRADHGFHSGRSLITLPFTLLLSKSCHQFAPTFFTYYAYNHPERFQGNGQTNPLCISSLRPHL